VHPHPVPAWLRDASYPALFEDGGAARALERPGAVEELRAAAQAADAPAAVRVLAHELLLQAGRPPDAALAYAYCSALPDAFAHNAWGMPGQYTERLGATLVRMGGAAVPCLAALLGDARPLGYFGSEEPTLSQTMGYRVCDLAADLLARIRGEVFPGGEPAAVRDAAIRDLRSRLAAE
jgi:hypothetical protein